jgi:hypothetical protein
MGAESAPPAFGPRGGTDDRVTTSGPASKALGAVFKATHAQSDLGKKALYMSVHLAFGTATMALALLHWYSFAAHTLFVLAICLASVWNASGYYFTVFTQRYEAGLSSQVAKAVPAPPPAPAPAPAPAPESKLLGSMFGAKGTAMV